MLTFTTPLKKQGEGVGREKRGETDQPLKRDSFSPLPNKNYFISRVLKLILGFFSSIFL